MLHNNQLHNYNDNTKFPQKRTQSEAGKKTYKKTKKQFAHHSLFLWNRNRPPTNAIRVRNKKGRVAKIMATR
jgi:hypothetical protein